MLSRESTVEIVVEDFVSDIEEECMSIPDNPVVVKDNWIHKVVETPRPGLNPGSDRVKRKSYRPRKQE